MKRIVKTSQCSRWLARLFNFSLRAVKTTYSSSFRLKRKRTTCSMMVTKTSSLSIISSETLSGSNKFDHESRWKLRVSHELIKLIYFIVASLTHHFLNKCYYYLWIKWKTIITFIYQLLYLTNLYTFLVIYL